MDSCCCRDKRRRCGTCGCVVDPRKRTYYIFGHPWFFCDASCYTYFVAYLVYPPPPIDAQGKEGCALNH